MRIRYISWNYGRGPWGMLHLIRLKNGSGLLRYTSEMVALGLCRP